jgi:hypothetical protein
MFEYGSAEHLMPRPGGVLAEAEYQNYVCPSKRGVLHLLCSARFVRSLEVVVCACRDASRFILGQRHRMYMRV